MGESNLISAEVLSVEGMRLEVDTPLGRFPVAGESAVGQEGSLSLRPEHLHLEPGPGRREFARASLRDYGFFGTHHFCLADIAALDAAFKLRLPQRWEEAVGVEVSLYVDPADLVFLSR